MKKNIRISAFLPGLFLIFVCILMMKEQPVVRQAVSDSLAMCAYTVIPSLFPFTVLALLLSSSNAFISPLFYPLRPLTRLLRLPPNAVGPLLSGFLCGFPLGTVSVSEMYRKGELTRHQANRLLALAHNTGPAFIISLSGSVLFENISFGLFLYVLQILSALLIGIIVAHLSPEEPLLFPTPISQKHSSSSLFAANVSRAAASMLSVSAMIVLFRVFSDIITVSIPIFENPLSKAFFSAVLECTSGVTNAAALGGIIGAALAGLSIGWSGISVLSQCLLFTEETDLSLKLCMISKIIQGVICSLGAAFFAILQRGGFEAFDASLEIDYRLLTVIEIAILGVLILLTALIVGLREKRKIKNHLDL